MIKPRKICSLQSFSLHTEGWKKKTHGIVISLLFLFAQASLAAPLASIHSDIARQSLLPHLDILFDNSHELTAEHIVDPKWGNQFSPLPVNKLHFGFEKKTYWLRFTLKQHEKKEQPYFLEISPALIDHIDIYRLNSRTGALNFKQKNGDFLPIGKRQIKHPLHIFPLLPEADGLTTYYIRISSQTSIDVQLHLSSAELFIELDNTRQSWSSWLYGILFALILIQVGLSFVFRKMQHLLYATYILVLMCFQASWDGTFFHLFTMQTQSQEQIITFFIYLAFTIAFLFIRLYLNTKTRTPKWDKTLLALAGFSFLTAITIFYTSHPLNGKVALIFSIIYTLIILSLTTIEMIRDNPKATSYFLSRFCSFIAIFITLICALGYLNYPNILRYGVISSLAIESFLITLFMIYFHLVEHDTATKEFQHKKMEKNNQQSLSDIIRKISHDIRTPMSGISGMAELLLYSPLTENQRKQVLTIKNSGDNLLNLISNLSTSPGMDSEEIQLQQISFNLPSLISECIDTYQTQAEGKQLELISDIHYSVPKLVRGDPNRLQQIIMHLLSMTFSKSKNGEIVVTVRASKASSHIEFDIVNTGIEDANRFTSMLEKLDRDTDETVDKEVQEFTIAQQLCKLMDGQLGVEPNYNNSIRIWFTANLPGLALDESTEREYDNILRKRKLLIVDDNETFRQVIQQQASSWGMQISSARSGMEALAILRSQAILEEQFDVCIIDYRMPTMSGLQLAEKIKEDPLLQSRMLIIMLTGVTKAPSTKEAHGAGIRRVLTKPVSAQSLKITLAEELSSLESNSSNDVSA